MSEHDCRYEGKIDRMGEDVAVLKTQMSEIQKFADSVRDISTRMTVNIIVTLGTAVIVAVGVAIVLLKSRTGL